MRILIIGPLGAGKSSLAYTINKKYGIPRLNIDEICRNTEDGGSYYPREYSYEQLKLFMQNNKQWVAEGSQKHLYEKMTSDLIVDMRVNRWVAMWRFTMRFLKAKKLIGKTIDKDLPVQAYHYRKITLTKIRDYDVTGQEINAEIAEFLRENKTPVITCKGFKQYQKVFDYIENAMSDYRKK